MNCQTEKEITVYKVVTRDMKSLGLRRNPHIIVYPIGEWLNLPQSEIVEGKGDYGGIWAAKTVSCARGLFRYMKREHGVDTRIFRAVARDILYKNSYRVKMGRILLREEISVNGNFLPTSSL